MSRTSMRLLAVLFSFALIAAACGDDDDGGAATADGEAVDPVEEPVEEPTDEPADDSAEEPVEEPVEEPTEEPAEERTASDIGITEDSIKVAVLIADLDGLRDIGFPLADALTTEHLVKRYEAYFDRWNEEGGINGRMIETVAVTWNPLDTATMEETCTKATLDEQVFLAMNANGFSQTFIPCFAVDNDTPFLYGEVLPQSMIDEAPTRLFAMNPTSEIAGQLAADLAIEQGFLPDGAPVGILGSSDNLSINAAGLAVKDAVEAAGFETEVIEISTLRDDNAAINADGAATVATFTARGAGHVFNLLAFTQSDGFLSEVGEAQPDWDITVVDAAASNCTPFGASRVPASAIGSVCVTAYSSYGSVDGGTREDTDFEAECRAQWIEDFGDQFDGKSDPGVPSGDIITTVDGEMLYSDYAPTECSTLPIIREALTNAGVNPTRDSFAEAMLNVSGLPIAFRSNGSGGFAPDKNYYADQVWALKLVAATEDTPRGEDGTFNGCPAPVNCWVPVTGEWVAIN